MTRRMSCSLTVPQVRARVKRVTRRASARSTDLSEGRVPDHVRCSCHESFAAWYVQHSTPRAWSPRALEDACDELTLLLRTALLRVSTQHAEESSMGTCYLEQVA